MLFARKNRFTGDRNNPVKYWENSGTHYFASKIPDIFAEKVDRTVWVNSTRDPTHSIYLPTCLGK